MSILYNLNAFRWSAKASNEKNYCEVLEVFSRNYPQVFMKDCNCEELHSKIYRVYLQCLETSCGDHLAAFLTFSEQCTLEVYLEPYQTTKMNFLLKTLIIFAKSLTIVIGRQSSECTSLTAVLGNIMLIAQFHLNYAIFGSCTNDLRLFVKVYKQWHELFMLNYKSKNSANTSNNLIFVFIFI